MKSVKFKVIAAIIVGTTIFGTITPALAAPISDEAIEEVHSKQKEYEEIKNRITQLHIEMDEILDDITYFSSLIDENNLKIDEVQESKRIKEDEIAVNEKKLDEKNSEYGERLRAMYKQGNSGIIDALLGSDSLADLVSRADAIIKIAKIDKELLDAIEAIKTELIDQKDALQKDIDALNELKALNQENLAAVEVKKQESKENMAKVKIEEKKIKEDLALREAALIGDNEALINDVASSDADLVNAISALREGREHLYTPSVDEEFVRLIEKAKSTLEERKLAREREARRLAEVAAREAAERAAAERAAAERAEADRIAAERAAAERAAAEAENQATENSPSNSVTTSTPVAKPTPAPKPSTGSSSSSSTGQAVANYAHNFLGIPYVWGGNDTNGIDCSGLTRLVYKNFGVNIHRVSRDQARQGKYIPISEIQPGDMLYFGQSRVTHVGIYIGGGKMIHAPKPGEYVEIASISWHLQTYAIQGARRFVN